MRGCYITKAYPSTGDENCIPRLLAQLQCNSVEGSPLQAIIYYLWNLIWGHMRISELPESCKFCELPEPEEPPPGGNASIWRKELHKRYSILRLGFWVYVKFARGLRCYGDMGSIGELTTSESLSESLSWSLLYLFIYF